MKPEQVFGANAGKVWAVLDKSRKIGPQSVEQLMMTTKMTRDAVIGALGWLGRENKIDVVVTEGKQAFKLV